MRQVVRITLLLLAAWPGGVLFAQGSGPDRRQAYLDLSTSLRLLCVATRPGDEEGATLALYRRGRGVRTAIAHVTCGEGGESLVGPERGDALRVVRMDECEAAAGKLGADALYLHLPDLGPKQSDAETLRRRGEARLRERLVWAIRRVRPHVVIFAPPSSDGNSQGMVDALAAAVRDAADVKKFDDHLEERLFPWQVRRLFVRGRTDTASAVIDVSRRDAALGVSPAELGDEARACHASRGHRRRSAAELPAAVHYRRVLPPPVGDEEGAADLFAGLVGYDQKELELKHEEDFRRAFAVERTICDAGRQLLELGPGDPRGIEKLVEAIRAINELSARPFAVKELGAGEWFDEKGYQDFFRRRTNELSEAMRQRLGIRVEFTVDADRPLAAGERFALDVKVSTDGDREVGNLTVRLEPSPRFVKTYVEQRNRQLTRRRPVYAYFKARVLDKAVPTLPKAPHYRTVPTFEPALRGVISGRVDEQLFAFFVGVDTPEVVSPVQLRPRPDRVRKRRGAEKGGGMSVAIEFRTQGPLFVFGGRPEDRPLTFKLWAEAPAEVGVQPDAFVVENSRSGEPSLHRFELSAPNPVSGASVVFHARLLRREEPETLAGPDYAVAVPIDMFEGRIKPSVRVGVVPGHDIGLVKALAALGVECEVFDRDLAVALPTALSDSRIQTLLVGEGALGARPELRSLAEPLLAFVEQGGVLVYLSQRPGEWNPERGHPKMTPRKLELGPACIADENTAVKPLAEGHPLLTAPNAIGADAFRGWVGALARNLPTEVDSNYTRLLSVAGKDGRAADTALLLIRHGKGAVIYSALALARQLDAAVPGAYRLLANLAGFRPEGGS